VRANARRKNSRHRVCLSRRENAAYCPELGQVLEFASIPRYAHHCPVRKNKSILVMGDAWTMK
jgi:hypothetical protein